MGTKNPAKVVEAARVRLLDLDVCTNRRARFGEEVEDFIQGWNVGESPKLFPIDLIDLYLQSVKSYEIGVMVDNPTRVARTPNIEFDALGAQIDRRLNRLSCVFRSVPSPTPMGDQLRMHDSNLLPLGSRGGHALPA